MHPSVFTLQPRPLVPRTQLQYAKIMDTENSRQLVVVTGASGFIALHCIQLLLNQGYRVRGTLRDLSKEGALRACLGENEASPLALSFAPADLTRDDGWDDALKGADFVLHTASPVPPAPPKNIDELVIPAQGGTLRVLAAAAAAAAAVKRVVVTSSIAAILSGHEQRPGRVFTENDWSQLDGKMAAYSRSKTLAERSAWQFVEGLPDNSRFELVTLNPSYVLGPSLGGSDNTSNEIVRKLLAREVPGVPQLYFPIVDVRDVAEAHVLAMTSRAAAGERFILSSEGAWFREIAETLEQAGYHVPTREVPNWLVTVLSWFDPTIKLVVDDLGWKYDPSNEKARKLLGFQPRAIKESLIDTAKSITDRNG